MAEFVEHLPITSEASLERLQIVLSMSPLPRGKQNPHQEMAQFMGISLLIDMPPLLPFPNPHQ